MIAQPYRRPVRNRSLNAMRIAAPGRGAYYIVRENSPYSLALDYGGLGGFSLKKVFKKVAKVVKTAAKDVGKFAWKGAKQTAAFTLNAATLGLAGKFTSVSKWSGAKRAGKWGTVVGIAAAAYAGGSLLAGMKAGGAVAAGTASAAGTAGATGTASWLSMLGAGAKTAAAIAGPAVSILKMGGGGVTQTSPTTPGEFSQGNIPSYGGGGGGYSYAGGLPVPGGEESIRPADTDWIPFLLIGAIGVVLITQRR